MTAYTYHSKRVGKVVINSTKMKRRKQELYLVYWYRRSTNETEFTELYSTEALAYEAANRYQESHNSNDITFIVEAVDLIK